MYYAIPETLKNDDNTGNVIVSTRFMEGYQILRPLDGGADLMPFLNSSGLIDIYSVGTKNRVFRLSQRSGNNSVWQEEDLEISATQLFVYVTAQEPDKLDNPNIFGINENGELTLSIYRSDLGGYVQEVSQPSDSTKKIKMFRAAYSFSNVYANVILEDDTVATSFLQSDGTWASSDWVPVKKEQGSSENAKAKAIALCVNNPLQTALYAIGMDNSVLFAESRFRFTAFTKLPPVQAIALAVAEDSENRLNIFAVDTNYKLHYKRQKKYSTGETIQWEDWQEISGELGINVQLSSVRAVINKDNLLEVFGIGTDDLLYHGSQTVDNQGKITGWTGLFPLGNPVPNSIMAVGRNKDGYSEVYTVSHDDRLYRFWQDPDTTQWNNYEIQLEETGEMVSIPTHSVELLILDEQQNARPETAVKVWASSLASVRINGLAYIITADTPASVRANGAGKVVIQKITNSLSSPTYSILTDFMKEGEAVDIEPNARLQDRLYQITEDDVWNAKDAEGNYLLSGDDRTQQNAQNIAAIMRKSMSINKEQVIDTADDFRYLRFNSSTRGLSYRRRGDDRQPGQINPTLVEEQHWQVDFSSGVPVYRELTREQATTLIAHKRTTLQAAEVGGFLGIDWGDIWNSIKEEVCKIIDGIKEFIVTTIVDPISGLVKEIKVVFTLLIEGIEYLIDKTIEFVQQAFDIIEGIWNKIKVFFKKLYEWLAFLFNWKDIVRTADVLEHSFNVLLDYSILALEYVKGNVKEGFELIKDKLDQAVNDFLNQINNQETVKDYGDSHKKPAPALDDNTAHNPVLNALVDNGDKVEVINANLEASEASLGFIDNLEPLIEKLKELAANFEFEDGKQAFEEGVAFFSQIGDNPDQLLNLLLSGIIKITESIALFTLDVAEGLVLSLIDVFKDLIEAIKYILNQEWEIPIVSQLYKFITGENLTFRPLRIFALVLAVPITIVYKVVRQVAPFPDQASVDVVKQNFTADWLAVESGIKSPTEKTAQATEEETWQKVMQWVSNISFGVTYVVRAVIEPIAVYEVYKASAQNPVSLFWQLSVPGLRFVNSVFSIPWLTQEDPYPGFNCKDMRGFGNHIWLFQLIFGPTFGLAIVGWNNAVSKAGKNNLKLPSEVNEIRLVIWGFSHLTMVIVQATAYDDKPKGDIIASNVMSCVATQILRFCAIKQVIEATEEVSWGALTIAIVGTYIAIATITWVEHPDDVSTEQLLLGAS